MRKMFINGVPHLWKSLSWTNPSGDVGSEIIVAYAENDPHAQPLFFIDNNGTNPLGGMSWANWIPTNDVHFVEPDGKKVSWE